MKFSVFLLIFSDIVFNSLYIYDQKITAFRIILFIVVIFHVPMILNRYLNLSSTTKKIIRWALVLTIYKFNVDLFFHANNVIDPFNNFLKEFFVILLLPILELNRKVTSKFILFSLLISSIIPVIFGFIQIEDSSFILPNIINFDFIGFSGGDGFTKNYLNVSSRVVGTYNIAIGFALLLGYLIIIALSFFIYYKNIIYLLFSIIFYILIIFTQTRSAIYGIIPSLLLSYILAANMKFMRIVFFSICTLFILFSFSFVQSFITQISDRSYIGMDVNTYAKITSNIYGLYGSFVTNPIIGVAESYHSEAVKIGRDSLGIIMQDENNNSEVFVTFHNIFGYYFICYGSVGFILLINLIYKIIIHVMSNQDEMCKFILLSLIMFFLQYALLHNNELLLSSLIWIFISMNCAGFKKSGCK